jgi:hypothetical protein
MLLLGRLDLELIRKLMAGPWSRPGHNEKTEYLKNGTFPDRLLARLWK